MEKLITMFYIALEILTVIIGGYITSFWLENEKAFLVSIVMFLLIQTVSLRLKIQKTLNDIEYIKSLVKLLEPHDKVSELALLYGFKHVSGFKKDTVWVDKKYVFDFWRDCMIRAEKSWSIISYTSPEETWSLSGWRQFSIIAQQERIANGCQIERIFCVDNLAEQENLHAEMKSQVEIGVQVSWITKEELFGNKFINEHFNDLHIVDVALFDDSWVLIPKLDKKRYFLGAYASREVELVEKVSFAIREAKNMAKEVTI